MNPVPHNHQIEVRAERFNHTTIVNYGDTKVELLGMNVSARRLKRAINKAIHKHDIGTIEAAELAEYRKIVAPPNTKAQKRESLVHDMNKALLGPPTNQWLAYGDGNEELDYWPSQRMPEWEEEFDPKDAGEGQITLDLPILPNVGDLLQLRSPDLPFTALQTVQRSDVFILFQTFDRNISAVYDLNKKVLTWKETDYAVARRVERAATGS